MLAVALDEAELDEYHWWINSQLESKKQRWKWSSPDKAGTIPFPRDFEQAGFADLVKGVEKGFYKKTDLDDVRSVSDRPILYITENRELYTPEGVFYLDLKGLPHNEIAAKTREYMVIPRAK